jgi:hypothetical protein
LKRRTNVLRLALAVATASVLATSSRADIIDNCIGVRPLPCYSINLTVPGSVGNMTGDSELSPVDGNLSGLDDRLVGSGSAFAVARFGSVGAKTEATNTSPVPLIDSSVGSLARATFQDVFLWNGGAGKLRFILNLAGTASATGVDPGFNVAGVGASLTLSSIISTDEAAIGGLSAPGSTAVTIDMLPSDGVNFTLDLHSFVGLTESGHGLSDFIDTFGIARIEQLDRSGNFVSDVTLTDLKGNLLGASVALVPEPPSLGLLGAGLIAFRILTAAAKARAG